MIKQIILWLSFSVFNMASAAVQYEFYINDHSTHSICQETMAGESINPFSTKLSVTLNLNTLQVSSTTLNTCHNNQLHSVNAPIQAAFASDNGVGILEVSAPISSLAQASTTSILLSAAAKGDLGEDVLTATKPFTLQQNNASAVPVPVIGLGGLAVLLLLLSYWGSRHVKLSGTSAVIVTALVLMPLAFAVKLIVDGNGDDWSTQQALGTDSDNDPTQNENYVDLTQLYAHQVGNQLFLRLDANASSSQTSVSANDEQHNLGEDHSVNLTLSASDTNGNALSFSVQQPPMHGTLSTVTTIDNQSASVTYTPNVDYFGNDSFTFTADNGQGQSATATHTLTINPVNDAPTFSPGAVVTVLENSGTYTQPWANAMSAGASNESTQMLHFNVTNNSNPALFSQAPQLTDDGILRFTPAANTTGTATLDITLQDDGGTVNGGQDTSTTATLTINVNADTGGNTPNQAPTFTVSQNTLSVDEDSGIQSIAWAQNISAGAANETGQTLTFTLTETAIDSTLTFDLAPSIDSVSGDVSFTSAANAYGQATYTVVLRDNGGTINGGVDTSTSQILTIDIQAINDAPTVIGTPHFATDKNTPLTVAAANGIYHFVNDEPTEAADPNGSANPGTTLSVQTPLPTSTAQGGSIAIDASTGGFDYTPTTNFEGNDSVDVNVCDDGLPAPAQCVILSLTLIVDDNNQAPSATAGTASLVEDSPSINLTLLGSDPDGDSLTFSITQAPTNGSLSAISTINGQSASVTYTPNADYVGTDSFTFQVDDGNGKTATATYDVTVTAVNDAPSFTPGATVSIAENSGAYSQAWASNISAGAINENGQTLNFIITGNSNPVLFSVQPNVDNNGVLSFTPAASTTGTATLTLTLNDNGGTANGGADTSASVTFNITVDNVNDAPSFTAGGTVTVLEDSGTYNQMWASAISAGPANESGQILTFNLTQTTIDSTLTFAAAPTIDASTGNVSFTPAANAYGQATYSVVLQDNGGTANGGVDTSTAATLTIIVTGVNDAPTVASSTPIPVTTNTQINVPANAGLLQLISDEATEAADPNGSASPGTTLSVQTPTPTTTTQGGDISINATDGSFSYNPPAGFTGTDTVNVNACDDGLPAPAACTPVTLTFNISGATVWYIDNSATSTGDGRLTTPFNTLAAFQIANTNTSGQPGNNDKIFIANSGSTYDSGTGVMLLPGQLFFGSAADTGSFDAFAGISAAIHSAPRPTLGSAGATVMSTNGDAFSTTIASPNSITIAGVEVNNTPNGSAFAGQFTGTVTINKVTISGNGNIFKLDGNNSGILTASDLILGTTQPTTGQPAIAIENTQNSQLTATVTSIQSHSGGIHLNNNGNANLTLNAGTINNTGGAIVSINGQSNSTVTLGSALTESGSGIQLANSASSQTHFTGTMTLNTTNSSALTANHAGIITATNANNVASSSNQPVVNLQNSTIGAAGIQWRSLSANGGQYGLQLLNNTSSGVFQVNDNGNTAGSGGTLQNTSLAAALINNHNNVRLHNLIITNGTDEASSCLADVSGVSGICHGAVEINNAANIYLSHVAIDGNGNSSDELGIYARSVTNFDMNGVSLNNVSDNPNEHGIYVVGLSGTGSNASQWDNLLIDNIVGDTAIVVVQNNSIGELNINDADIRNAMEGGIDVRAPNASGRLTVNLTATASNDFIIENTHTGALFIAQPGNITANVTGLTVRPGAGVPTISRSLGSGTNGMIFIGISGQSNGTGTVDVTVDNTTVVQEDSGAGGSGRSVTSVGGSSRVNGSISNNTLSSDDAYTNAFYSNFTGMGNLVDNQLSINDNSISMPGSTGALQSITGIHARASSSSGQLGIHAINNNISYGGNNSFSAGIVMLAGQISGTHNNVLCANVIGNHVANTNTGSFGHYGFVQFGTATLQMAGLSGAITDPDIDTYIVNNDAASATTIGSDVNATVGSFVSVSSCL